jgi:N-acyl-L-homoserine lactone synthetase
MGCLMDEVSHIEKRGSSDTLLARLRAARPCVVSISFLGLADTPPELALEMFRARKRTFVDDLGWVLPSGAAALEVDSFDREGTVYAFAADDETVRYSARILPRDESMVAELWPRALERIPAEAVEFSRFCPHYHSPGSARWNRASTAVFKAALLAQHVRLLFGIADERMLKIYRVLAIAPDEFRPVPDTDGLLICQWRL